MLGSSKSSKKADMKKIYIILLSIFCSCGNKKDSISQEFSSVSNFNIQLNALTKDEPFRLLMCSSGNTKKSKSNNLVQFVAIKTNSGDTINILGHFEGKLKEEDGDYIFYYIPNENADEIKKNATEFLDKLNKKQNEMDVNIKETVESIMVVSDPNLSGLNNNYPTVIGEIVKTNNKWF